MLFWWIILNWDTNSYGNPTELLEAWQRGHKVRIQNRLTFLFSEVFAMTCSAYFIYLTGRTFSVNNKEGNEGKRQKTQNHRRLYQQMIRHCLWISKCELSFSVTNFYTQVDHFINNDLKTWQNSKTWECQEEIKIIWLLNPYSVLVTWFTTWFRIQKLFEYIFPVQCIYVI